MQSTETFETNSANAVVEGLLRLCVANFFRDTPLGANHTSIHTTHTTAITSTGPPLTPSRFTKPIEEIDLQEDDDEEASPINFRVYMERSIDALLEDKATLKKRLRQYDISFEAKYGRKPEKLDKEPIRHLYQRYHDLKKVITRKKRDEPEQMTTNAATSLSTSRGPSIDSTTSLAVSGPSFPDSPSGTTLSSSGISSKSNGTTTTSNTKTRSHTASDTHPKDGRTSIIQTTTKTSSTHDQTSVLAIGGTNSFPSPSTIKDLKKEKRRLQVLLREYEDKFMAQHGRKVRYRRDIQPVAVEYKRYKEIKNALKIAK